MSFFESYKHLEKICGEIYGNADKSGISAYIDEMCKISDGSYYVDNWNEDLEMLKHYRSIRNQISHEPGYTEENLCTHADEVWLDDFYSRIMTVSDPLALYTAKTKRTSQALMSSATKNTYVARPHTSEPVPKETNKSKAHRRSAKKNIRLLLSVAACAVALFIVICIIMFCI